MDNYNVNDRRLIEGPKNKLMMISPVKHQFAKSIWEEMKENTWFPSEVELSDDISSFKSLSQTEQDMYKKALAFLSNLDGIQLNNLVNNINQYVTSPEVSMCLVRQAYEEALHVESYSTLIESMDMNPLHIYTMFTTDPVLKNKNEFIMGQSATLEVKYTPRNFALALVANIVLEGIYFYSGFLTFYVLAKHGKMLGSAKMIRFIQRDEIVHLKLFVLMFKTLQDEQPELFTSDFYHEAYAIVSDAVNYEAQWGKYIIEDGVLGLTHGVVEGFINYLADERLKMIGMQPMYNGKNPIPWFDSISTIENTESNYFETKIDNYKVGKTLVW